MASSRRAHGAPATSTAPAFQVPHGSVRSCALYRDELARHRLITADGHDFVVSTVRVRGGKYRYLTGAYPVQLGYLVLVRLPLCESRSLQPEEARVVHERLVRVLADAGVGVVRARRALAARQRAERPSTTAVEDIASILALLDGAASGSTAPVLR